MRFFARAELVCDGYAIRMKHIGLGLIVGLCFIASASAQGVLMKGYGLSTCGDYIAERGASKKEVFGYVHWTQGYLSGYNGTDGRSTPALKTIPGPDTIFAYVDKYCAEHPLSDVVEGVQLMMADLLQRQRRQ